MNSEERLIKTLRREEVDRVPHFEWIVDTHVIEAISPGSTYEDFVYEYDLDAICVTLDYTQEEIEPGVFRDEWGVLKKYISEDHSIPVQGCIKSQQDFRRYEPPDPHAQERFHSVEAAVARYAGQKAIILHLNDVVSIPRNLMGYQEFLMATAIDPELIMELAQFSAEYNLILAKEAVNRGVNIIYTGDDFAYNSGPLVSPRSFRKLFYPGLCKVIRGFKDLGLYVMKHTDGDIMSIIDMIVDSGIDCLDPLDPIAGMKLQEIKHKYGEQIALKGNVDCAQTLSFGTTEEVIAETKQCLRDGAPGGGYILSSSNTIHSSVKPENYLAMLEMLKMYGNYPIVV
jgi:uroporphyrinogen decarboxylase